MDSTLTIKLGKEHRAALRKRARAEKKTESEIAGELVAAKLDESPLWTWDDIKHLAGCVKLPKRTNDSLKEHIRRMNWRT